MLMQDTGDNATREPDGADDEGSPSEGDSEAAEGDSGQGTARDGSSAACARNNAWEEMKGECSEGEERRASGGSSDGNARATAMVGEGRAREREGPGKWRRVTTLARWEPSARAHMLSHLEDATIDVTGD